MQLLENTVSAESHNHMCRSPDKLFILQLLGGSNPCEMALNLFIQSFQCTLRNVAFHTLYLTMPIEFVNVHS